MQGYRQELLGRWSLQGYGETPSRTMDRESHMLRYTRLSLIVFISVIVASLPLSVSTAALKNDAPEANEYIIKMGDVVKIVVVGYEADYSQTVVVQKNGKIEYTPLGTIRATGLTAPQLEDGIKEKLEIYISDPRVEVSVRQGKAIIQPGDAMTIAVEGYEDYNKTVVVQPNGKIEYGPLGEIQAEDLAIYQLEDEIRESLKSLTNDAQVTIIIERSEDVLEDVEVKKTERKELPQEKAKTKELQEREHLIRPGDIIDIVVMERNDYSRIVMVQPNGKIMHPALGEMPAAGFTEKRLSQEMVIRLSHHISNPQVQIVVTGMVDFKEYEADEREKDEVDEQEKDEADEQEEDEADEQEEYFIKPRDVIKITVRNRSN